MKRDGHVGEIVDIIMEDGSKVSYEEIPSRVIRYSLYSTGTVV